MGTGSCWQRLHCRSVAGEYALFQPGATASRHGTLIHFGTGIKLEWWECAAAALPLFSTAAVLTATWIQCNLCRRTGYAGASYSSAAVNRAARTRQAGMVGRTNEPEREPTGVHAWPSIAARIRYYPVLQHVCQWAGGSGCASSTYAASCFTAIVLASHVRAWYEHASDGHAGAASGISWRRWSPSLYAASSGI